MDVNGDGKTDLVSRAGSGDLNVWSSTSVFPDLLTSITPTYGPTTTLTYKPLTDTSVYTKETSAVYPVKDVQSPIYVVSSFASSNGVGATNTTTYAYTGMKEDQQGRGNLGFHTVKVTAPDGSVTTTEYSQVYPYIGMPLSSSTVVGGITVSSVVNTLDAHWWSPRAAPYVKKSVVTSKELTGALIGTVTTDSAMPDDYGNVAELATTTSDGFVKKTTNTYYNDTSYSWRLGQLVKSVVTSTVPAAYSGTALNALDTRTVVYSYDVSGRVVKEVVQPATNTASSANNTPTFTLNTDSVVTTYAYHPDYGYRSSVSVSGIDVTSTASPQPETFHTTTTAIDFVYSTVTTTNAANHAEVQTIDTKLGVPLSLKGPNGLATSWLYDGFGRKTRETRADGTYTTYDLFDCGSAGCDLGTGMQKVVYYASTTHYGSTGVQLSPSTKVYVDTLGRALRTVSTGFNGTAIYKDTKYDSMGRVDRVSNNYFSGSTSFWTIYAYDALGRAKNVTGPDNAVTTSVFAGLITTVTAPSADTAPNSDGKTRTHKETKTLGGVLDKVTDALSGTITYKYDAWLNPVTVTVRGADGKTTTTTSTYDLRGRKKTMVDPDMGAWSYTYTAFGEVYKQTDAKSQVSTMTYDVLGRMIKRVEVYGTSMWTYDTSPDLKGKGKIYEVPDPFLAISALTVMTHWVALSGSAH